MLLKGEEDSRQSFLPVRALSIYALSGTHCSSPSFVTLLQTHRYEFVLAANNQSAVNLTVCVCTHEAEGGKVSPCLHNLVVQQLDERELNAEDLRYILLHYIAPSAQTCLHVKQTY